MTDELQRLRDRVEELEYILGIRLVVRPKIYGVSKIGWVFLGLLAKRKQMSRESLFSAVYGGRSEERQPKLMNIVDQYVHRLNRYLAPYDISIRCERGSGIYGLDSENHKRLVALVNKTDRDEPNDTPHRGDISDPASLAPYGCAIGLFDSAYLAMAPVPVADKRHQHAAPGAPRGGA